MEKYLIKNINTKKKYSLFLYFSKRTNKTLKDEKISSYRFLYLNTVKNHYITINENINNIDLETKNSDIFILTFNTKKIIINDRLKTLVFLNLKNDEIYKIFYHKNTSYDLQERNHIIKLKNISCECVFLSIKKSYNQLEISYKEFNTKYVLVTNPNNFTFVKNKENQIIPFEEQINNISFLQNNFYYNLISKYFLNFEIKSKLFLLLNKEEFRTNNSKEILSLITAYY